MSQLDQTEEGTPGFMRNVNGTANLQATDIHEAAKNYYDQQTAALLEQLSELTFDDAQPEPITIPTVNEKRYNFSEPTGTLEERVAAIEARLQKYNIGASHKI